ncbi:head GIN domain-containing protein [Winogradskyella arenosi]|uniref:Putative autotransporter adhesin-like protein n=1 Tax=Winogradskyella arenosi TaxID=533325 RepID=A0A368ZK13_9FLAO|nr:head GIN domain-containing protein [Winogradskyella arenosi]RCW94074.1 putative autotransporter adhesin-like protein [Winogradskyella arenosi]
MKKLIYILGIVLCFACNSEEVNDCFQTSGDLVQQEITVPSFEGIIVHRDVEVVIKHAENYKVTVETGENLMADINVEVVDNQLILTDNNTCNYFRTYGLTKVFVEAPDLKTIRSSTQYDISSDGLLQYEELNLISESYNVESEFTIGDFRLEINSEQLNIISNNLAFFYMEGTVENLDIGFFSGAGRFEGANLVAQHVNVYHRGSNDMIVNSQLSLTGQLKGTGHLIAVNEPLEVDVERFYTGQLFIE